MLVVVVFCVVSLLLEQSITVHGYRSSTSTCIRNTKSVGIKRSSLSLGAFSDDSYASSTFPQLQRGQIVFLSDMNLPGVLRQRTKDSTWIIEVFYQNKSIGFVEREESTISIDSQRENNLVPENSDVDSQRLEELKNIMRWVKNNLGVRALSPVAATPSARPRTLGLHRYGIAPRGIPVHPYYQRDSVNSDSGSNSYSTQNYRYQSPRLSSTDFLISSLPINSPEVYENDALVSALSTALYRRGKVVEAQRLLQNNRASKVNKALSTAAGSAYDPYAHRLELRDAEGQHRMGDLSNSLSRYKEVLDRNQEIAESNFLYGVNLHDMGRVFEAIPYYQRAIELNPRHGNAYRNLGVAYSSLGMRKGALNCFYKCLAFDTEKVSSLVNIAALLWQSNDINDKRNAFQYIYEAMELAPDDARPRELLKWFLSQSASDLLQDTSSADGASVKLGSWFEDDLKGTETQQELEEEEIWRRELQQRMAASQTSIDERDDRQANLDDSYYVNTARDRLANDVLPQDHIAEEKRLMVEEKDMM